jgi:hypothetical protein
MVREGLSEFIGVPSFDSQGQVVTSAPDLNNT